ncbi:MAG: hypothetical protein AMS21_12000 [Gemmatimonas sp. SG8_38_2]|nr:MAG: hypothetical protein AMS21_12000 [Gemmatimonas sp. SG8_38_2]
MGGFPISYRDLGLFNRILRATDVFIGSYYNSHTISIPARILLQASAFEILLDLPDTGQRRQFKDDVERRGTHSVSGARGWSRFTFDVDFDALRSSEPRGEGGT